MGRISTRGRHIVFISTTDFIDLKAEHGSWPLSIILLKFNPIIRLGLAHIGSVPSDFLFDCSSRYLILMDRCFTPDSILNINKFINTELSFVPAFSSKARLRI